MNISGICINEIEIKMRQIYAYRALSTGKQNHKNMDDITPKFSNININNTNYNVSGLRSNDNIDNDTDLNHNVNKNTTVNNNLPIQIQ